MRRYRTKPRVFGAVERGGQIRVKVFAHTRGSHPVDEVSGAIQRFVLPASMLFSRFSTRKQKRQADWPP